MFKKRKKEEEEEEDIVFLKWNPYFQIWSKVSVSGLMLLKCFDASSEL